MKNILKQTLILASIMIFVVFFVSYLMIGITQEIALVFELFLLSFLIVLIQQLIKRAYFNQCFLNIVMEYLTISISVLLYGYFVDWFVKSNWWMVFLYVAIVYIPAYFLDMGIVRKDVKYINSQLRKRWKNEND